MDETEVKVVANAIGFSMFQEDGRPITVVSGVEQLDLSGEETERCKAAARRAIEHLDRHRSGT